MVRESKIAKTRKYVLIELLPNVFRENTMNEMIFPNNPNEITVILQYIKAVSKP